MARLSIEEAKEMASRNGGSDFKFFSLKDRETIKIRFLISSVEEVERFSVHTITMADNKKKNVNCLRALNEPVQNCPLCAIGNKARGRIFLNVVDEKTHDLLIWERSVQFLDQLEGYIQRYGDLRDYLFEVERKGTGLDTEYQLYPLGSSPIEDKSVLPQPISVLGRTLLEKTYDDLTQYINTGAFVENTQPTKQTTIEPQDLPRREEVAPTQPQANNNSWGNSNSQPQANPPKRNGWN